MSTSIWVVLVTTYSYMSLPFYAKYTIILLGACLSLWILWVGADVFVPLLFSLFFAILLNPLCNWLQRRHVHRVIAISLALLLGLLVIGGVIALLIFQFKMCAQDTSDLQAKFNGITDNFIEWCAITFKQDPQKVKSWFTNMESETGKTLLQGIGGTIATFGNVMITVFAVPVYVFLLLYYKPLLLEFIARVFPKDHHKTVSEVLLSINAILKNYLFGLLIEMGIVAALNSVGLLIIGVKYAILLGITGAILNLLPYIGGIVAVLLTMAIAFLTKSAFAALMVLILFAVIQFVDNHYLVPYIVASRVRINAIICIAVVIAGGLLWGVAGMFVSIPLTALIKVVFDHIEALKPWGFLMGDTMPETTSPILFKWPGRKPKKAD